MCDFQATSLKVKRVKAASPSPSVWCGVLSTYQLIKMPSQKVAHSGAISVGLGWTTGWGEVYSTNKHLHMAKTVKPFSLNIQKAPVLPALFLPDSPKPLTYLSRCSKREVGVIPDLENDGCPLLLPLLS